MTLSRTAGSIADILHEQQLDTDSGLWAQRLLDVGPRDVQAALASPAGSYSLTKLLALVSPAAEPYIEQMAELAQELTLRRFGRTVRLYAPLYLSSYCINRCKYCGFNRDNQLERTRLTIEKALAEADILASEGFRDILLVSSEDRAFISVDYIADLARRLRADFIGAEVYQMSVEQYRRLFDAGIEGITLYQETYDRRAYARYHLAGRKANYDARLRGPDDIAGAGMREIGLGVLLGLADWRIETLALAEHARYLVKRYWKSHISFSFPRLRPAHGVSAREYRHLLSDKDLIRMMLALRLCFPDAGIVLSTREPPQLRDRLVRLGVTRLSAGSRTSPGGYSAAESGSEQFQVNDSRTPAEVASVLAEQGLEPVWKDWDPAFRQF